MPGSSSPETARDWSEEEHLRRGEVVAASHLYSTLNESRLRAVFRAVSVSRQRYEYVVRAGDPTQVFRVNPGLHFVTNSDRTMQACVWRR
jgi:hypothetical protein